MLGGSRLWLVAGGGVVVVVGGGCGEGGVCIIGR